MLHLHFGAGRLGLGLVAPFFRRPGAELHLFNRATSGANPTGGTGLAPGRRNELLRGHPGRRYVVQKPGGDPAAGYPVGYDRFATYAGEDVPQAVRSVAGGSEAARAGVVVTASVLTAAHYAPVADALSAVCDLKARDAQAVGPVFLVACENAIDAREVLADPAVAGRLTPAARGHVVPVPALVDRLCVWLEEGELDGHPAVVVRAEEYGSLKLGLAPETEPLAELCRGTRVEFSRHVGAEKQIKSWLLNGTHWLVALSALQAARGDPGLRLNEYLSADPEHRRFAEAALGEMGEGVAILLRSDPAFADFVREVDVDRYLDGARRTILDRFAATADPLSRILARFRAPTPDEVGTIEAFNKRFGDRVDAPLEAYMAARGTPPPAASRSLFNLHRLLAEGSFAGKA